MIRPYRPADLPALRQITVTCFDGTSVDQNIEVRFGPVGDRSWQERKARTVDADAHVNPDGIFVSEVDGQVVGYITSRIDRDTGIGWIPNMGVLPQHQRSGIGSALLKRALDYLQASGMDLVRIETLEQNAVGPSLYPRIGFQEVARQIHYAMRLTDRRI